MNEDYVNGEMLENFSNYNKSQDYPIVWSSDVWEEKNIPPSCRHCSNHPHQWREWDLLVCSRNSRNLVKRIIYQCSVIG